MIFGLPVVKCYSEALALLGDSLECLQQAAHWILVGVAGVTKPGLKGECWEEPSMDQYQCRWKL